MYKRKVWISILCCILIVVSFPCTTAAKKAANTGEFKTKDEVIYGNLAEDGHIEDLYVVNSFEIVTPGEIVDYGNYRTVRNLTDLSDITHQNNKTVFDADNDSFYYQGELINKPLPWDISITYLLDGEVVNAKDLVGKSGHLDIQIKTSKQTDIDPVFFDYYLLQIALTLDPLIFKNIQAPKATEANEGKNKTFSFTVMPEQEAELIISTDVHELEMDPIDISAVPANIAMDDPDISGMTSDMRKLADGINEINQGIGELASGLTEWKSGATQLKNGSKAYRNGIQELDDSSDKLVKGSEQILDIMNQVSGALQHMPDIDNLDSLDGLQDFPNLLRKVAKEIKSFSSGLDEIKDVLDYLPKSEINNKQFQEMINALEESDVNQDVIDTMKQVQNMYEQLENTDDIKLDIPDTATTEMTAMASELETLANEIESNMQNMKKLGDLEAFQQGLITMAEEYTSFHDGLVNYTNGVHELAQSYLEIDKGIEGLVDSAGSLENGATELHKGTQTLHEQTADLPNDMQTELDEMMGEFDFSNFEPVSFVSEKNGKVDVVQFVLQTEKIEIKETEKTTEESEEKSLWDRFLNLFR